MRERRGFLLEKPALSEVERVKMTIFATLLTLLLQGVNLSYVMTGLTQKSATTGD